MNESLLIEKLESPRAFLAPMAGVTDAVYRSICAELGCGMTCTEMVSAKGLHYGGRSSDLLAISDTEKQAAVQLFGCDPNIVSEQAAKLCESDPDGRIAWIDINMGCPAPKITRNGEGSALMKTPDLAERVASSVVKACDRPVTVKFRKGWDDRSVNAVEFAQRMENAGVAAITVHGRTREQMYTGRSDRNLIQDVVNAVSIPVIANGDIFCAQDAKDLLKETGAKNVMVARGAQGNPWIFSQIYALRSNNIQLSLPAIAERIDMALRHAHALFASHGEHAVAEMRKHVGWYIEGSYGAAAIRASVNRCHTMDDLDKILTQYKELQEQLAQPSHENTS